MTRTLAGVTFAAVLMSGCGEPTSSQQDSAPPEEETARVNPSRDFGITANNVFFYYDDLERARAFYTETLGVNQVADYGGAVILRVTATSYLILVDASGGMHTADEPKSVALAFESYNDEIRLFPAMPQEWKDAAFYDLPAQGGLRVSAQWRDGRPAWVRFTQDGEVLFQQTADSYDFSSSVFNYRKLIGTRGGNTLK